MHRCLGWTDGTRGRGDSYTHTRTHTHTPHTREEDLGLQAVGRTVWLQVGSQEAGQMRLRGRLNPVCFVKAPRVYKENFFDSPMLSPKCG